jgi:glyoxylase-like metal-dependent hydrolase (beta-lactamase superfamily II)
VALADGDSVELGNTIVSAIATPGHAPAHLAYTVADRRRGSTEPWLVFASDNAASIRVLTKCGFLIVGEGRGFAHGRNEETDEVVLRLDA